eukprot:scaffold38395_cov294-Skeletonema_dohrnii-CCMP3373.AAC.1
MTSEEDVKQKIYMYDGVTFSTVSWLHARMGAAKNLVRGISSHRCSCRRSHSELHGDVMDVLKR